MGEAVFQGFAKGIAAAGIENQNVDAIGGSGHGPKHAFEIDEVRFDPDLDPSSREEQPTLILDWHDGQTASTTLSWHVVGMTHMQMPQPHFILLGLSGQAAIWIDGTTVLEVFDGSNQGPSGRGVMRDIARIDDTVWAVGMSRQANRSINGTKPTASSWERIHDPILPPLDAAKVTGFDAVDGFSSEDVYFAGWQGEIWQFNQGRWQNLPSMTNVGIERIVCAPDQVYAAGQLGVLLQGRGERWKIIAKTATKDTIRGLAWFTDHLWVATNSSVFRLEDDNLVPVILEADDLTARLLTSADGQLWSIGAQHIFRTDDVISWPQFILQQYSQYCKNAHFKTASQ